jgi:hypothetical protein
MGVTLTRFRLLPLCAALACVASLCAAQSSTEARKQSPAHPKDEMLRQELLRMREADQAVRARMIDAGSQSETIGREMIALDAAHTKRLLEIFKTHGYPSVALVGKDGAEAAYLLVLHGPSIELQKKSLAYLKKAVRRGESPPDAVAGLTDMLNYRQGKPQVYGTRFEVVEGKLVPGKIKDPSRLHARRAKLGLMPMSEYVKRLEEMYGLPVETQSIPR